MKPKNLISLALVAACMGAVSFGQAPCTSPYGCSLPEHIFAPGDHVPLSAFFDLSSGFSGNVVVRAEVLTWIKTQPSQEVKVAVRRANGSITYGSPIAPSSWGTDTVPVALSALAGARFTLVSSTLVNHFIAGDPVLGKSALLTHWNQAYDPGVGLAKGKQQVDASDGLVMLSSVNSLGEVVKTLPTGIEEWEVDCSETSTELKFKTWLYNLFSDGTSGSEGLTVPAAERFIAENWTKVGVSKLVCVWLSDRFRADFGWPILHRNGEQAFSSPPGATKVMEGVPVLQLVHSLIVDGYEDTASPGKEQSLITIGLPPFWQRTPTTPYPILLESYYDVHESTFGDAGKPVFRAIGELYDDYGGKQAVAVFWNAGGSGVSQSKQASAQYNALDLLNMTVSLAAANKYKVVMTGGSRGGTAALSITSNPLGLDYRIRFVVADTPVTSLGRLAPDHGNPTFPLVQSTMEDLTGRCGAWQPGYVSPETGKTATFMCNEVLFGNPSGFTQEADLLTQIAAEKDNSSPLYLAHLKTAMDGGPGTADDGGVVIRCGTHDMSKPFPHFVGYYEALREYGIPVHCEISYRYGHTYTVVPKPYPTNYPTESNLLNKLIDAAAPAFPTGLFHYKRPDETLDTMNEFTGVLMGQIDPLNPQLPQAPVVLEFPVEVGKGQPATWTVTGPPSTHYEVWAMRIQTESQFGQMCSGYPIWLYQDPANQPWLLFSGNLPASSGTHVNEFTSAWANISLTHGDSDRTYIIGLYYKIPQGQGVWIYGLDKMCLGTGGSPVPIGFPLQNDVVAPPFIQDVVDPDLPSICAPIWIQTGLQFGVVFFSRTGGLSSESHPDHAP